MNCNFCTFDTINYRSIANPTIEINVMRTHYDIFHPTKEMEWNDFSKEFVQVAGKVEPNELMSLYYCRVCGANFATYKESVDHESTCNAEPKLELWTCQCGFEAYSGKEIREHVLKGKCIKNTKLMETIQETLKDRGKVHGNFVDNANIAQYIKDRYRSIDTNWDTMSNSMQEALDMIGHKIARILAGDPTHVDHWHDIAGYATLVENELNKK